MTSYACAGRIALITGLVAGIAASGSAVAGASSYSARPGPRPVTPANNHTYLYASGQFSNGVNVYDLSRHRFPLVSTISTGLDQPAGMALDATGRLYVVNEGNGTVSVYKHGVMLPKATLTGIGVPLTIAIDANGDIYVSNPEDTLHGPSIAVYTNGSTTPSYFLNGPLIAAPNQIFFDGNRNLYVIDDTTGVYERPAGSDQFTSLGLTGLGGEPSGLALDPTNGNLFESNASKQYDVRVYPAGQTAPAAVLRKTARHAVHFLTMGTLRGELYLFVPLYGVNQPVYLYPHDALQPVKKVETNLNGINGILVGGAP